MFIADSVSLNVRLVGGDIPNVGRAEYFNGTHWGTICDDSFYVSGWPSVFCVELGGYENAVSATPAGQTAIGAGTGLITYAQPNCASKKGRSFDFCVRGQTGNCTHDEDQVIECKGNIGYVHKITLPHNIYI